MAGSIINRGRGTWLVRLFLGLDEAGKRRYHNKTIHGTKREAEDALAGLLRERGTGNLTASVDRRFIGSLLDDLLTDYRINGKDLEWAESIVEKQLRPEFGQVGISKLNGDRIQRFIRQRQEQGRANATINRELALLRRAMNLGRKADKVGRVPFIPTLKENNVRKGFFERADYSALLGALADELRPVLTFAYFTGCRKGEILALQWSQVDLENRVVRLEAGTTKNGDARLIPLAEELFDVLKLERERRDTHWPESPWVFSRNGRRIVQFKNGWAAACERAGLWDAEAKRPTRLFHDLRRTGVRNLVRAGVPERVAMMVSGHRTRAVFDRYNIVSEGDLRLAALRLSKYHQEQSAGTVGAQAGIRQPVQSDWAQ